MKRHFIFSRAILGLALVMFWSADGLTALQAGQISTVDQGAAHLFSKKARLIEQAGTKNHRVSVIVRASDAVDEDIVRRAKSSLNNSGSVIDSVLAKKFKNGRPNFRTFKDPRLFSMVVDEDELDVLLGDPEISVFANRIHTIALAQSVPLIFPAQNSSSYDGTGQKVVLIDTGVSSSHSFLSGAVDLNSAACFSNDGNSGGIAGHDPASESLCPNGAFSMISASAGEACDIALAGCNHGTQMAGIIAGNDINSSGVATGAQVIPIQAFTKIHDFEVCNSLGLSDPCIGATTADLLAALEYVNSLNLNNVAAVNISFGTTFTGQGNCDSSLQTTITQIVDKGVAVIASSGNSGSDVSMTSPACIEQVISVASTNISHVPSLFNNRNSELDFFAPGEAITTSTLPDNQFSDVMDVAAGGTSAAAAHVAGAWAVMKSKNSSASVATVESALKTTGVAVTQSLGTPVTAPRIMLDTALDSLEEGTSLDELCVPIKTVTGNVVTLCL